MLMGMCCFTSPSGKTSGHRTGSFVVLWVLPMVLKKVLKGFRNSDSDHQSFKSLGKYSFEVGFFVMSQ